MKRKNCVSKQQYLRQIALTKEEDIENDTQLMNQQLIDEKVKVSLNRSCDAIKKVKFAFDISNEDAGRNEE